MTETWLPVVGWEHFYDISDHGNVRTRTRVKHLSNGIIRLFPSQPIKPQPGHGGYLTVILTDGWGHKKSKPVHLLVLETFVEPRPPGLMGCHGREGQAVNGVWNLRWDTQSNNIRDCLRKGTHPSGATEDHCGRGHHRTPENTYVRVGCKTCDQITARQRRCAS